jgi:hypothetical protein
MPRNKFYALECRATNPTRWNAAQQNLHDAAQQILRAEMPRNKSYTMPRNKSYAYECPAKFPKEHMQDGDLAQRRQTKYMFSYITWT